MDYQPKFFNNTEQQCHCGCGVNLMQGDFMRKLDQIREELDTPLTIVSAYRCAAHNTAVSTTGETGPHTTGRAVDIAASGRLKFRILEAARARGMTRFGIGKSFIHIDDLGKEQGFPGNVIWSY